MATFERKFPCLGVCEVIVTRLRSNIKLRNRIYYNQEGLHLNLTKDETCTNCLRLQLNPYIG